LSFRLICISRGYQNANSTPKIDGSERHNIIGRWKSEPEMTSSTDMSPVIAVHECALDPRWIDNKHRYNLIEVNSKHMAD